MRVHFMKINLELLINVVCCKQTAFIVYVGFPNQLSPTSLKRSKLYLTI